MSRVDDLINDLSKHRYNSKYGSKNAYHQIPLHPNDKKLTAFVAKSKLLQFKWTPFEIDKSSATGSTTNSGRISKMPTRYDEEF